MDEETLRIILEAHNLASPVIKRLIEDLKNLDKQVKSLQSDLASKGLAIDDKAARAAIKAVDAEYQRFLRHRAAIDRQYLAERSRLEREDLAKAAHTRRMAEKSVKDAVKEVNDLLKEQQREAMRVAREMDRAAAEAERMARAASARRSRAVGSVVEGGTDMLQGSTDMLQGSGRMAGATLRFVGTLAGGTAILLAFARAAAGPVVDAIKEIESAALGAGERMLGLGEMVRKAGFEFNTFKENTLLTLDAMTKSAGMAQRIFDFAMKLSIPAKFTFEEVLEGARTLEAFGLKLDQYGQATGRYLTNAVVLAQGMEKPLAQVTRFLGNLSQGRYLLSQAAPLGMGRDVMGQFGAQFDSRGHLQSGGLEAAMKAIESRFPGLLEKMQTTFESSMDAMISAWNIFTGRLTEGLHKDIAESMRFMGDFFRNLVESNAPEVKSLMEALKTPFELLGAVIKDITKNGLPEFTRWLSEVLTKENIVNMLAEIVALFRVMFDDVKAFIDIASGGKGLVGIWESFRNTAVEAINAVMEVWGGFMGGLDYLVKNGDKIWAAITAGAKGFQAVIETIVGLLAIKFAAEFGGGAMQFGKGMGGVTKGAKALMPGGGPKGAMSVPMASAAMMFSGEFLKQFIPEPLQRGAGMITDASKWMEGLFKAVAGEGAIGTGLGFARGIGKHVIGGIFDTAKGNMPPEIKDLWAGFQAAVATGRTQGRIANATKRPDYAAQARGAINGLLKRGKAGGAGGADSGMPPPHQMFATAQAAAAIRDPAVVDAIIDAYEQQVKGLGKEGRPGSRMGLIGLYRERLAGEQAAVSDAASEMRSARDENGNVKSEADRQKDAIGYWKAVQQTWKTQAEIMEIQREAAQGAAAALTEAAEARTQMIEAQIEMLPESQQAAARAEKVVPELKSRMEAIVKQMGTVQQGTKEWFGLQERYYRVQKQVADLQGDAADQAAKQAFEGPQRQFNTLKKLIGILPKSAQKGAMTALLGPRVEAAFAAAGLERDPVKRGDKLLEVADMFAEMNEARKAADPFKGFFDSATAAARGGALADYQARMFGMRGMKRNRLSRQRLTFGAMSPFAPQPGMGGDFFAAPGGDVTQIIMNLRPNASDAEIADAIMGALRNKMRAARGR